MDSFQLAMLIGGAAMGLLNLFIGLMLKVILDEQRSQRGILREIETQYYPRREFERYEEKATNLRHEIKESITAIEIRLGDWQPAVKR